MEDKKEKFSMLKEKALQKVNEFKQNRAQASETDNKVVPSNQESALPLVLDKNDSDSKRIEVESQYLKLKELAKYKKTQAKNRYNNLKDGINEKYLKYKEIKYCNSNIKTIVYYSLIGTYGIIVFHGLYNKIWIKNKSYTFSKVLIYPFFMCFALHLLSSYYIHKHYAQNIKELALNSKKAN